MVCLPVRKLVISMTSQEACMNVTIKEFLKVSNAQSVFSTVAAAQGQSGSVFFSNCNLHCELPAGVANLPSSDIRLCVSLKPMTKLGGWRCQLGGGSDAAPRDARALSSLTKLLGCSCAMRRRWALGYSWGLMQQISHKVCYLAVMNFIGADSRDMTHVGVKTFSGSGWWKNEKDYDNLCLKDDPFFYKSDKCRNAAMICRLAMHYCSSTSFTTSCGGRCRLKY